MAVLILAALALTQRWSAYHPKEQPLHRNSAPSEPFVYVYDIPNNLLIFDFRVGLCQDDMYATEFVVPQLLRKSRYATTNSNMHDRQPAFYYVPAYPTCLYHHCLGHKKDSPDKCKRVVAEYMSRIYIHISTKFPHWNSSGGTDHIFTFSWDQASEIVGWDSPIRTTLSPAIHLTALGVSTPHANFNTHKDIVIPTYNPDHVRLLALMDKVLITGDNHTGDVQKFTNLTSQKSIFAYFRGTVHEDYKYSLGVRQYLVKHMTLPKYHIHKIHSPSYYSEISSSVFTLCPSGWSHWSPRIYDAILLGSIPVVFSDGIQLPFEDDIPYLKMFLKIFNGRVHNLDAILSSVSQDAIQRKQVMMRRHAKSFVWNLDKGSAFELVIQALWDKRKSSRIGNIEVYY